MPRSASSSAARAVGAHLLMRPISMGNASYLTKQLHELAHLHVRNYRNGSGKDLLPTHVILWCCACVTHRFVDDLKRFHCSQKSSRKRQAEQDQSENGDSGFRVLRQSILRATDTRLWLAVVRKSTTVPIKMLQTSLPV